MSFVNSPVEIELKPYKKRKPLAERKTEVELIRRKYPSKVPIIIERYCKEKHLPVLDRTKFIYPEHLTMHDLTRSVRKRMCLEDTQAIYLLVNNRSFANFTKTLSDIYRDDRDTDGFLYVTYASEMFFGN